MDSLNTEYLTNHEPSWEEKRVCDGCTIVFEQGDYVATYFSDWVWNDISDGKLPFIAPQGMYCLNCYEDEIPLPMKGVTEGFIFGTITYNEDAMTYSVDRNRIMRGSRSTEGIDWDPIDITNRLFPAPAEIVLENATPYSVFSLFYRAGIDLRGFISENVLEIPEPAAEKSKLTIQEWMSHNRGGGIAADPL